MDKGIFKSTNSGRSWNEINTGLTGLSVSDLAIDPASQIPMVEDDHNYEVVAPPAGATVPYLPEEADEETIGGKKYFVYAGTYYRPFASDGETIYMVVEDPRRA